MIPRRLLILPRPARQLLVYPTASSVRARLFHSSRPQRNVLVDLSQQVFQQVHTSSGLSWAASIPLTACLFRLTFAPIHYWAQSRFKTTQIIQPLQVAHSSILAKHAESLRERGVFKSSKEYESFMKKGSDSHKSKMQQNYKFKSATLPTLLGWGFLPIWAFNFGVVQAMASMRGRGLLSYIFDPETLPQPEPGFETDGFLWIASLSEPDPTFFVLPGTFALLTYLSTTRIYSSAEARSNLKHVLRTKGRRSLEAAYLAAWVMLYDLIAFAPFIGFFIMTQATAAVQLLVCGSAASQAVLKPVLRWLVGSPVQRGRGRMIPRIPKLKHRYRDMHSMDDFRPPSGTVSQAAVSQNPQAIPQDSGTKEPSRMVAQVPRSPATGQTTNQRR